MLPATQDKKLVSEIQSLGDPRQGNRCLAGRELENLPEEVRSAVEDALWNASHVATSTLANLLALYGCDISAGNLGRHRRLGPNGCRCAGKPALVTRS